MISGASWPWSWKWRTRFGARARSLQTGPWACPGALVGRAEFPAAVNDDFLPGDVTRAGRGEKQRQSLEVLGKAHAVHGNVLAHQLLQLRVVGMTAADVGDDEARRDGIDGHIVRGHLQCDT